MDIAEIAIRTGIQTRTLRYVLEHGLVRVSHPRGSGRGFTREFPDQESFRVALAASLLEAGLRRRRVIQFVSIVTDRPREFALTKSAKGATGLTVDLADGVNYRVRKNKAAAGSWKQLGTNAALAAGYTPTVIVNVNLSELRRKLQSKANA